MLKLVKSLVGYARRRIMSLSLVVVIVTIFLVSLGLLALAFWFQENASKEEQKRFKLANPAKAKIIEIGTSIVGKSDSRISAALRFEVIPDTGKTYKARSPWVIEPEHLGQIRVGESIAVKIDAKKKNIVFPDVAWARYDWTRQHEIEPIYED
jgi:hypothetical protein